VKYLVEEKGVDPKRLVAEGRGEDDPRTIYKVNGEYTVDEPAKGVEYEEIKLVESYINQYQRKDKAMFERLHQYNRRTEGEVVSFDYVPEPEKPEGEEEGSENSEKED
jgi:hypothetical protein